MTFKTLADREAYNKKRRMYLSPNHQENLRIRRENDARSREKRIYANSEGYFTTAESIRINRIALLTVWQNTHWDNYLYRIK